MNKKALLDIAMEHALNKSSNNRVRLTMSGFVGLGLNGTKEKEYYVTPIRNVNPVPVTEYLTFIEGEFHEQYMVLTYQNRKSFNAKPFTVFVTYDTIQEIAVFPPYEPSR